ncbi:Ribonuclease P/MRP protein subunit POP5, partial [Ophiophagus hannah]
MVRFRNRYFLCEIISEDPRCRQFIEERIVHNAVKNAVARIHGDFGAACCSNAFSVKYLNAYTRVVLFCCRKDFYRLLWSSLPFITQLENRNQHCPCSFHTLHVGGCKYFFACRILMSSFSASSNNTVVSDIPFSTAGTSYCCGTVPVKPIEKPSGSRSRAVFAGVERFRDEDEESEMD